ncbi:DNA primase large subunit [Chlamydoabsidia padenii]|nr:DNA primase large subunit [Chlamydoabsidia padenii]
MLNSGKNNANRFAQAVSTKRRRIQVVQNKQVPTNKYPCRLDFYLGRPPPDITIEEFESFGLDRLQVLKVLETATLHNTTGEEYNKTIQQALDKYLPMTNNTDNLEHTMAERRKEHISHFVLRLVYCRDEESRQWLLQQERALFRFRFEQESTEDKKRFLETTNLGWKVVDPGTKKRLQSNLEKCAYSRMMMKPQADITAYVANETYFEVDFEKVPGLLLDRDVYLHKGKAYIPMSNQTALVIHEFTTRLSKMLETTAKSLPRLNQDTRLEPILINIKEQYDRNMYTRMIGVDQDVKAAEVDMMVEQHAPLCMQTLHGALRRDKHLKYGGRMQYGLFLKAIGLSIEEALLFWRTAFANKTDEQFQKEYAYNIRHNYGLEGRRVDYSAYSCSKIIKSNAPSTGDHHGCPFRHSSNGKLEASLFKNKLSVSHVKELMGLVHNSQYQVACTRYFALTHPNHQDIDMIEHPNSYYEHSLDSDDIQNNN